MKNERSKAKGKDEEESTSEENENVLREGDNQECVNDTNQAIEKEKLLTLYQTLKDLGINSIGDLEVKISRL